MSENDKVSSDLCATSLASGAQKEKRKQTTYF